MEKIALQASVQPNSAWAIFHFSSPIGITGSLEFKSIDEAQKAPLVQQLFYLPFVKSVRLDSNTIQVERFDILEWEDVVEEVKVQLENYLNEGGMIIEPTQGKTVPVTVYAESTPNPAVMKFVANKTLVSQTIEFKTSDQASPSPLAQELFRFPFVKEVFLDANYISITKTENEQWEDRVMELREFIRAFIASGQTLLELDTPKDNENNTSKDPKTYSPIEAEIISILDEYIKPAVASDGGNIQFDSYDENEKSVRVLLQGACSGCPSSTFTLKSGIETMLKDMLPSKVETVIAVND